MERIEDESLGLSCRGLADVFIGRETLQGLQSASEVVSSDEVGEMVAELLVALVVEAVDRCFLDGPVHPFDLTVCPRVLGLGQTMVDIVLGAGKLEGMRA